MRTRQSTEVHPGVIEDNSARILASILAAKTAGTRASFGGLTVRTKLTLSSTYAGTTIGGKLDGGILLNGWALIGSSDTNYSRFSAAAQAAVYVCDLAANGVASTGTAARRYGTWASPTVPSTIRLYTDTGALQEAKWPATGYAVSTANANAKELTFDVASFDEPSDWTSVRIHGFPVYDWRGEDVPVSSFSTDTVTLGYTYLSSEATTFNARTSRFYLVGAPEWVTAGTWWADPVGLKVYYWPSSGTVGRVWADDMTTTMVEVTGAGICIDNADIRHTRLTAVKIGSAATGSGIKNSTVMGCERAIELAATSSYAKDNDAHSYGYDGIGTPGIGDRETLTSSGVVISGNDIHDAMRPVSNPAILATAGSGASSKGVGYLIEENNIYNVFAGGILTAGNSHTVRNNTVIDAATEVDDSPGIYCAGCDYTWWGTLVENNFVSGIYNRIGSSYKNKAIYLDNCSSGNTVRANKLRDVEMAVLIGGGRSNAIVDNDVEIRSGGAILHMDARAVEWASFAAQAQADPSDGSWATAARLAAMDTASDPWASAYPDLAALDTTANAHCIPNGNTMSGNTLAVDGEAVSDYTDYITYDVDGIAGADFVAQNSTVSII